MLKLNRVQEVVYAIALLSSTNSDTVQYASQFLKQKLPDLIHSYVDAGVYHVHIIRSFYLKFIAF